MFGLKITYAPTVYSTLPNNLTGTPIILDNILMYLSIQYALFYHSYLLKSDKYCVGKYLKTFRQVSMLVRIGSLIRKYRVSIKKCTRICHHDGELSKRVIQSQRLSPNLLHNTSFQRRTAIHTSYIDSYREIRES